MSPMSSRMSLRRRPKTTVAPKEPIPRTREEQRADKDQKEATKQEAKATTELKKKTAIIRIESHLDKQATELELLTSLRPDLDLVTVISLADNDLTATGPAQPKATHTSTEDVDQLSASEAVDTDIGSTDASKPLADPGSEDEDEDARAVQKLEDEVRKQQEIAEKKAGRIASGSKRPGSAISITAKRSKPNEIGGLRSDWKKTINKNKKATSSHSSVASTDGVTFEVIDDGGEFKKEENLEVAQSERGGKSQGNSKTGVVEVKLEAVDANLVAQEERDTGKPAQPPKPRVKINDLPLVSTSDRDVWNKTIMPGLISWTGTQGRQFEVNAEPDFRTAQTPQIRNYRSKFGATGLNAVTNYLEENGKDQEEQKEMVAELLHHDAFIYESAGKTRQTSTGAFRGKLVMCTFAFYLTWAIAAPTVDDDKYPIGALALAVVAVQRALNIWKPGYNTLHTQSKSANKDLKRRPRNHANSFDNKYSAEVRRFVEVIKGLTDEKWENIFTISEGFMIDIPNAGAGPALKEARGAGAFDDPGLEEVNPSSDGLLLENRIILSP
ncbi:hypothetical protein D9757_007823 [Collybiopsis confluens]|uniref:DUF6532 domain-containing protein n=1 Tax=Collybiopsis confluens TaxID=2823264 RepID=A0A8H5HPW3_9AGAR|nr:hypothetical protein D9757_007823 [Collybiopsis confluens]